MKSPGCEHEYMYRCIVLQKLLCFKTVHTTLVRSGSHLDPVVAASNLPIKSSVVIFAPTKVFRPGIDRFKNLSNTRRSTINSGEEQSSPVQKQKLF